MRDDRRHLGSSSTFAAGAQDRRRRGCRGGVWATLVVALAAFVSTLAVVLLSNSPPVVIRANAPLSDFVGLNEFVGSERLCQGDEVLPRGTTAIRMSLEALIGPPVSLTASVDARVLTRGQHGAGWSSGSVTVPVAPLRRTYSRVTICATIAEPREPIELDGVASSRARAVHASNHQTAAGRMMVEYLRPGRVSWWSRVQSVARGMGLGRAGGGAWIAILAAAMMVAVTAIASSLLIKELT